MQELLSKWTSSDAAVKSVIPVKHRAQVLACHIWKTLEILWNQVVLRSAPRADTYTADDSVPQIYGEACIIEASSNFESVNELRTNKNVKAEMYRRRTKRFPRLLAAEYFEKLEIPENLRELALHSV
ncbi:hypothetical protein T08_14612 [Trichinella sp. T8]|nr:hypothetical protein T08_14612 [Trichinella sp. T8]